MEPLNDHEELKRLAPKLHGLPKADPFVVPESFFDRFPHQVQAAIVEGTRKDVPVGLWWKRLAIALPIIALLGLGTWWLQRTPVAVDPMAFTSDSLPADPTVMDDVDEYEVLALIEEHQGPAPDLGAVEIHLNETELLAYLDNENTDLTDLIIDLE